jgi:hypothetical protein
VVVFQVEQAALVVAVLGAYLERQTQAVAAVVTLEQRLAMAVQALSSFLTSAHNVAQAAHTPQSVDIQSTHSHLAVHLQLN